MSCIVIVKHCYCHEFLLSCIVTSHVLFLSSIFHSQVSVLSYMPLSCIVTVKYCHCSILLLPCIFTVMHCYYHVLLLSCIVSIIYFLLTYSFIVTYCYCRVLLLSRLIIVIYCDMLFCLGQKILQFKFPCDVKTDESTIRS